MDVYNQAIEVLHSEYEWQKSIRARKETIYGLEKKIRMLYQKSSNKRDLPESIRKLAEDPNYISVRDMEPKGDPAWEKAVADYGISNPPDRIEDMGEIMMEDEL